MVCQRLEIVVGMMEADYELEDPLLIVAAD